MARFSSTCKIKRLVDLLPDRTATTLEAWLKGHPGVQLISRDRAGEYATGGRSGAPKAVQVADRFHIQKNLGEAVERIFRRYQEPLGQIAVAHAASSSPRVSAPIPRPQREASRERTRDKRLQRYEVVRELYLQGVNLSEIARRFHMGRMTVQKFAYAETYPETAPYRTRANMLRPYEANVRERWQQGCRNASQLHREIVAMGYPGQRKQVALLVAHLRRLQKEGVEDFTAQPQGLTPRQAVALLMRPKEKVTEEEQRALIQMHQLHPEMETVMKLVESFLLMLRHLQGQQLEAWMENVEQSHIRELQNFIQKLRQDQAAVQAGLTLPWSNGVVEGHVNRLKCLKRAMYGRAQFDLLRLRVLYRAPSPPQSNTARSLHAKCG
jgi:transposase